LWLFALVLCARAFAWVHMVVEPHALCATHDELVHGESHAHALAEAGQASEPSCGPAEEREGHDEHCSTFSCARVESSGTAPARTQQWSLGGEGRGTAALGARVRAGGIPLLLQAPKTSPPASSAARA
jgi:hypothetical protein